VSTGNNPLDLSPFFKPENGEPWGNYDFDKPSLVVVASNDETGAVLWGVGGHIRVEMEEAGLTHLDDLGIHPPSAGVWIWEGIYVWSPGSWESPQDGSSEPVGKWRKPTEAEWIAIQEGKCPWDDNDWKLNKGAVQP
jgi:hypothetical protein